MSFQIAGKNLAAKRPVKNDPSSVTCSICGTEQWSGYGQCQKCGASFVDLQDLDRQLRGKQNLLFGVVAGIVAAAIAAILWAVLTLVMQRQIGWMAIGDGILVGFGVRRFGRGIDKIYGLIGATLALLGCVAGNLLAVAIAVSQQEAVSPIAVLLVLLTAPMAMGDTPFNRGD